MKIEFTPHARKRIEIRGLSEDLVVNTLKNPDRVLFDEETGNFIAVKRIDDKLSIVAYVLTEDAVRIVSAFVTSKLDLAEKRIKNGRWRET